MSGTEYGRVEIQAEYDDDSPVMARTRILRADPHVAIANSLLLAARAGELRGVTIDGDLVTITDDYGQRFVYQLGKRMDFYDGFEMDVVPSV